MKGAVVHTLRGRSVAAEDHAHAAWVHRRLLSFSQRLETGAANPAECSCIFEVGAYAKHSALWFMRMARQAVRRKYVQADRPGVVAWLDRLDEVLDEPAPVRRVMGDRDRLTIRWTLIQNRVRVAQRATRWRCTDVDLFACCGSPQDLTPWLFQQPDLRYRLHDGTMPRLRFMLACWAQYVEHGFTPQTAWFGLEDFPLSDALRPDLPPPTGGEPTRSAGAARPEEPRNRTRQLPRGGPQAPHA